MPFDFMQDPRWVDLDRETKDAAIDIAFERESQESPRFNELDEDTQTAVKAQYRQDAEQWDTYIAAPETQGFLTRTAKGVGRGIVGAAEYAGHALQLADLEPREEDTDIGLMDRAGTAIVDWAGEAAESPSLSRDKGQLRGEEGWLARGWYGFTESAPLSASVWGMAGAGALAGSAVVPGAGTVAGGFIGGISGLIAMFGAGTYGKEYSDIYKELGTRPGISDEERQEISHRAAFTSAAFEAGTELPENLLALVTLGGSRVLTQPIKATLKNMLRKPLKDWIKGTTKQIAGEVTGEMVAGGGQAWARQREGLEGPSIKEGVLESIVPAVFMGAFFGAGAAGLNRMQSRKLMQQLNSDDPTVSKPAARTMAARIANNTQSEVLGQMWFTAASDNIENNVKFDFDEKVVNFAAIKMGQDVDDQQKQIEHKPDLGTPGILEAKTPDEAFAAFEASLKGLIETPALPEPALITPDHFIYPPSAPLNIANQAEIDALTPEQQVQWAAQEEEKRNVITREEIAEGLEIDRLANEGATSPENDLDEPTEGQKEAGNYKKGHIAFQGMQIAIENPRGSERSGTDESGKPWTVTMEHHYGYFNRTEGKDGDQVDVIVGPDVGSKTAFIVDQINPETGEFDEHKTLVGFKSEDAAKEGYLANYEEGWQGLGAITEIPIDQFNEWLGDGTRKTEAIAYHKGEVAPAEEPATPEEPIKPEGPVGGARVPTPKPQEFITIENEQQVGNDFRKSDIKADNKNVGSITYSDSIEPDVLIVDNIEIEEGSRRSGFATKALEKIIDETGAEKIMPTSDGFTTDGQEFFNKFAESHDIEIVDFDSDSYFEVGSPEESGPVGGTRAPKSEPEPTPEPTLTPAEELEKYRAEQKTVDFEDEDGNVHKVKTGTVNQTIKNLETQFESYNKLLGCLSK